MEAEQKATLPLKRKSCWRLWAGILCLLLCGLAAWFMTRSRPEETLPYFVTWQAVVDQETANKLISELKSISVNAKRVSPKKDHSEATEIPEVSFAGYRGKGDVVRRIINESLAQQKRVFFSEEVNWVRATDEVSESETTGSSNSAQVIVERLMQLIGSEPIGSDTLIWNPIQDPPAGQDPPDLSGYPYAHFEVFPKARNALRISAPGHMFLLSPGANRELKQRWKPKLQNVLDFQWHETLLDRDAVVLTTQRTDQGNGELLISVCERVDLPTNFEADSPRACDMQQWRKGGVERMEDLLKRARDWSSKADPKLLAKNEWCQPLSDGRTVTLIAIGRHQVAPFCWWTPEGKPVRGTFLGDLKEIGRTTPGVGFLSILPNLKSQPLSRETDLRDQPEGFKRETSLNGSVYRMFDYPRETQVVDVDLLESTLKIPIERSEVFQTGILEVLFGVGKWTSLGIVGKQKDAEAKLEGRDVGIMDVRPVGDFLNPRISVLVKFQIQPLEELKLVAVHRDGTRFEGRYKRGVFVTRVDGTIRDEEMREYIDGIHPDDIDNFEVHVRPLEKLRFENVNFAPDGLTLDPENPTEQSP